MFLPQAVTAIGAALLGAGLTRRLGLKQVFLLGLAADLVSMAVLLSSQAVMTVPSLAYALLLLATASLGAGFGLTVPALNTFAAGFFPAQIGRAVLLLNALLGLGTALAPVFGVEATETVAGGGSPARPARFWVFAAFALLYGIVETVNGNWATLYMTADVGASSAVASLALTAFWAMVTVGRLLFAAVERWFPEPDHQLRAGGADGHGRRRRRRLDRLLPDGLRPGRLRRGPPGGAHRARPERDLWPGRGRRPDPGRPLVRRRPRRADACSA
jgi:hypothetical protein